MNALKHPKTYLTVPTRSFTPHYSQVTASMSPTCVLQVHNGHFDGSVYIHAESETYYIEPAHRYLKRDEVKAHTHVVYRMSDVHDLNPEQPDV